MVCGPLGAGQVRVDRLARMNDAAWIFTAVFCLLLALNVLTRSVLASRQIRHLARQRHAVPAALGEVFTLPAHQKAVSYAVAKVRFGQVAHGVEVVLVVGWTLLGGLHGLNSVLLGALGAGMVQQMALLVAFSAIGALCRLPLDCWATFGLQARFGFNQTTPVLWLADRAKGALVGALLGLPMVAVVLWLMDTEPVWWWLWAWGAWVGFSLLALVLYPRVIAPWFNRFEPLSEGPLHASLQTLMQRCGFAPRGLFVMDASRRTTRANAYFTGWGRGRQVVFFDTLLDRLSPAQVRAVLAHELGHAHHGHVPKRVLLMGVLSLLGFALLGWLSNQVWFYSGLGVEPSMDSPNHALALALFTVLAPLLTFFLSPLLSHLARRQQFEADAYAAGHTSGADLASALVVVLQDNASTLWPDPLYACFYDTHPPAIERLARLRGSTASSTAGPGRPG